MFYECTDQRNFSFALKHASLQQGLHMFFRKFDVLPNNLSYETICCSHADFIEDSMHNSVSSEC